MQYLDREQLKQNIEIRMAANMASHFVGGASLWVWQDGEEVYRNHFGPDVGEKTFYRLASMTKPVTAVAVLQQMEAGKLALTDPVDKFYPEFRDMPLVKAENGKLIPTGKPEERPTVMHLLTHTAGFGGDVEVLHHRNMPPEDRVSLQRTIPYYASSGIGFEPFSQVLYSGCAAFDILAGIVEKLSGLSFDEYLQKNIFTPCGMTEITFAPTREQWARMIPMHDRVEGEPSLGQTWDGCVFENLPVTRFLGGAGLASPLEDYTHFARMLLQGGEFEGNRILKPETVALMATPHVPESVAHDPLKRWGLSVRTVVSDQHPTRVKGSYGWSGAYGTHFWVDPENKVAAVILKNCRNDGGSASVASIEFEADVKNSLRG